MIELKLPLGPEGKLVNPDPFFDSQSLLGKGFSTTQLHEWIHRRTLLAET